MEARFTEKQLRENICALYKAGQPFYSVKHKKEYFVNSIDEKSQVYSIRYESGKLRKIPLRDLYAVYVELYSRGNLPRRYLRNANNSRRLVGNNRYSGSPGATLFGILPALDDRINVEEEGDLSVT